MPIDQRGKGSRGQGVKVSKSPRTLEPPNPKVLAIIPARYGSTRLPGKPLVNILGKPMIQHVWEKVIGASGVGRIVVATDDEKVYDAVRGFGGEAIMTSKSHPSGTDRIAEVVRSLPFDTDIIVNIQGDEPMIEPDMVDQVIKILNNDFRASIGTLCRKMADIKEVIDPNIVKVAFDKEGFALYFSRSPIPYYRNEEKETKERVYYKHIGIYSYRKDALMKLSTMSSTTFEIAEQLEQLRALENGLRIKVSETERDTIGVDTKEDLDRVIKSMTRRET